MQVARQQILPLQQKPYHHRQTHNGLPLSNHHLTTTTGPPPSGLGRTLKRKRGTHQYTVSYSEVQEVDAAGQLRDFIVIEDTPPPPTISPTSTFQQAYSASYQPPQLSSGSVRTRARAAAEAKAEGGSSVSEVGPPSKKRKRDGVTESGRVVTNKRPAQAQTIAASKSWASGSGATTEDTPVPCDDKEGHYIIVPDDLIFRRYRTVKLLGQGTFGKVIEAVDTHKNNQRVAIKIIRAIPKYRDASKIEVRVLQRLKERDAENRHNCIHLLNWFDHRNHICLVSELLGMCVYDFLKDNDFAPFPRHHIQAFARSLLDSVAFLHDLHLIHTDLKPENILLVNNNSSSHAVSVPGKRGVPTRLKRILDSTDIRLIDFGSATFESEYHSTVVSTRHYRAPEIILGLGWSYPCDAYSLGCILVEFYTGIALYQTHDNLEHLAMMEAVMGPMPTRFARAGARSKPEFFRDGAQLDWPKNKATRQSKKDVRSTRKLQDVIPQTDITNRHFYNLVSRLLAFDPNQRITVREALNHPYFNHHIPPEI